MAAGRAAGVPPIRLACASWTPSASLAVTPSGVVVPIHCAQLAYPTALADGAAPVVAGGRLAPEHVAWVVDAVPSEALH